MLSKEILMMQKIDLHCHLDGSLTRHCISRLLARTVDMQELQVADDCRNLAEYLEKFDLPLQCLQTAEGLKEASKSFLLNLKEDNISYIEVRFAPLLSVNEHLNTGQVMEAVLSGLEEGKKDDFKDVVFLKYFIRDYAKYLGLDGEKLVDEFNEFLFDFTSKIPVEEIEKAKNKSVQVKEVVSPYTVVKSNNKGLKMVLLTVFIIVVLAVVGYFIASYVYGNDFQDNNITYQIRR